MYTYRAHSYMSTILVVGILITGFTPYMLFAQMSTTYASFVKEVLSFLPLILSLTVGLIILFFAWRTGTFILDSDSKEVRTNAKRFFGWGLAAVFVASTIYGILSFILSEIGLGDRPIIPQLREEAPRVDSTFTPQ